MTRTLLLITLKGIIHIGFERQIIKHKSTHTHTTHTHTLTGLSGKIWGKGAGGDFPNYSLLRQATAASSSQPPSSLFSSYSFGCNCSNLWPHFPRSPAPPLSSLPLIPLFVLVARFYLLLLLLPCGLWKRQNRKANWTKKVRLLSSLALYLSIAFLCFPQWLMAKLERD